MNPEVAYASLLETSAAVGQLILIAMLLERALAFLFEYHWFKVISDRVNGIKAPVVYALSLLICRTYNLDILGELFRPEGEPATQTWIGSLVTAGVIGGGSAGAMTVFQNWFNWGKGSRDHAIAAKTANAEALKTEAEARNAFAASELKRARSLTT